MTDAGPGHVVAKVEQHRFQHVAEPAAGEAPPLIALANPTKNTHIRIATISSIIMNLVNFKSSGLIVLSSSGLPV